MRKLRLALIFVIAVIFVITAVSCGKKKPTEPEGGDAVLADEAVVLNETEAESIIEVTDDQIVLPAGTSSSIYQKGNVIMSGVTDAAPYGLLRKVESSSSQNGQIVVNTSQARLVDAFDQLDFHTTQSLKTADLASSETLTDGVRFVQDSKNPYNFHYIIDEVFNVGNNVTMYVDGELDLTMGYELDVAISLLRGLHHIKAGSFVTSDGDLELNVDGAFNYVRSIELYQHSFAPVTFWIPALVPAPIILVPKVIIVLDIDARGEAHVTATVSDSASVEAGLEYQKPNWSSYCEKNLDFDYDIPVVDASMNATVSAGPRFEINLFGVTGPWAHARGFLNLDADINANPWWTLTGGYVVDAGVHFEIFGYEESATIPNIINHSVVLAQASPNQVATPTFSPSGGTYTSAQSVQISCATPGATIRYSTNGSEPNSSSPIYSNPINVFQTTTIKAKAYKIGLADSPTASVTYTIDDGIPNFQDSDQLWDYCANFDWAIFLVCVIEGNNLLVWFEPEGRPDLSLNDTFSLVINNQTIPVNAYDNYGRVYLMVNNANWIVLPNSAYLTIRFTHNNVEIVNTSISVPSFPSLQNLPEPIDWTKPLTLNWSLTPNQNNRFQGIFAYAENDYDVDYYDVMIDVSARQHTIPANTISISNISDYEVGVQEMSLVKLDNCILMAVCGDYFENDDDYSRNSERIVERIRKIR